MFSSTLVSNWLSVVIKSKDCIHFRRLSKETVKVMGRQIGKLCHIHPITVFEYLLSQACIICFDILCVLMHLFLGSNFWQLHWSCGWKYKILNQPRIWHSFMWVFVVFISAYRQTLILEHFRLYYRTASLYRKGTVESIGWNIESLAPGSRHLGKTVVIEKSIRSYDVCIFQVGAIYKKYTVEIGGILNYVANQLKNGKRCGKL